MMSDEDFDEDNFRGMYENGEWKWDDDRGALVFISNVTSSDLDLAPEVQPAFLGAIEFKEDLDVLEQQRFRKLFARRTSDDDVVILQDIKDFAFYTAPKALLTLALMNILHQPMADRFLRALLFYCQYFIQISDAMNERIAQLKEKLRTPECDKVEAEFRDNLEDLRLLVAKEYFCAVLGCEGAARYHHMGAKKKIRSLTKLDAFINESIVRFSIQIVWLALARKSFNLIELEIHRLFKSSVFNIAEHNLKINFQAELNETIANVLYGTCLVQRSMMNTNTPLYNTLHCNGKEIDHRLLGIGTMKYKGLDARLQYFENVLIAPESSFEDLNISLGILGLKRSGFDTVLREVKGAPSASPSSSSMRRLSMKMAQSVSKYSKSTSKRSAMKLTSQNIYGPIIIPQAQSLLNILEEYPGKMISVNTKDNEIQRQKWVAYILRLHKKKKSRAMSIKKSLIPKLKTTLYKEAA